MSEESKKNINWSGLRALSGKAKSLIVLIVLLIFILIFQVARFGHQTSTSTFEYKIVGIGDENVDSEINILGQQGWELVFARRATDTTTDSALYEMIFKRKK